MMKKKPKDRLISHSNTKLGSLSSFALPTSVCDDIRGVRQQGCQEYCYAKKLERIYPGCAPKWTRNYLASLRSDFVDQICDELKGGTDQVRWHVSGDFYSQAYLEKVFEIAKRNPKRVFYTYTKNIDLDFSKRPSNFVVYLSDDNAKWGKHYKRFDGVARIRFDKGNTIRKPFQLCMHQSKGVTCDKCKLCTTKGNKITFNKH